MNGKKNLAVMFASPRREGHTRLLLDAFLEPFLKSEQWEISFFSAYEILPEPCMGCKLCAEKEGCAFSDLDAWDRALRESDALVIASPVYNFSFPAPMKAVLDRTQRYFEARFSLGKKPPIEKKRKAALLLTMGSEESFGADVAVHQLARAFTVMNTELYGHAVWSGTDKGDSQREKACKEAGALALEIMDEL